MASRDDGALDCASVIDTSRRTFLQAVAAGALTCVPALASLPALAAEPKYTPLRNRAPLIVQPYMLLPLGSIRPAGWLRRQLEIQAGGLGGHLDEVWPDVGPDSGWLGGPGEAWERGPYFLDGLLPLAWLLDSGPLKAKAQRFIDWTLSNPSPDGMIGPRRNNDWWPPMVMLKALAQYHEVTSDARVIPVMTRYFRFQLARLPKRPLRSWSRFRWQDELVTIIWLYNRTGDVQLLELAHLLHAQGWDWRASFEDFPFKERITRVKMMHDAYRVTIREADDRSMLSHGVNNAMGLKACSLWSLISGSDVDRLALRRQLAALDTYHGLPIGIFSADEHFAGRGPSQGVELCAIVEALYSLEHALAITGDSEIADRIERIAYNALPAAFTDDMWAHQYDQQPNQIECSIAQGPWATNGPDANLFGLEPHFGCCTANFHQGWPKFTASLWMATSGGGLAAMLYAPCEVATRVNDVPIRVSEITDYPFRPQVQLVLSPERSVSFPLKLRVPRWSQGMKATVNGRAGAYAVHDGFLVIDRNWKKGDRVDMAFNFEARAVAGFNQAVSVERGPLLYSLPIVEGWEKLRERGLGAADWEVHPKSAWNYGLLQNASLLVNEREIASVAFSAGNPPGVVIAEAQRVPQWTAEPGNNYASPPPQSLLLDPEEPIEKLTLVPYGAAKLRITAFPEIKA